MVILLPNTLYKLFGFPIFWFWVYLMKVIPIFWFWVYLMKVIPEMCRTKFDIYIFINPIANTNRLILFVCLMVFNVTFNNILVISWWSVLSVEDPEKTTDLSQVTDNLYHIMLYTSPWSWFELTKSNYHTITVTSTNRLNFNFNHDKMRNICRGSLLSYK